MDLLTKYGATQIPILTKHTIWPDYKIKFLANMVIMGLKKYWIIIQIEFDDLLKLHLIVTTEVFPDDDDTQPALELNRLEKIEYKQCEQLEICWAILDKSLHHEVYYIIAGIKKPNCAAAWRKLCTFFADKNQHTRRISYNKLLRINIKPNENIRNLLLRFDAYIAKYESHI